MKRFWLFAGRTYYPVGGMFDFVNSFDSEKEAIEIGAKGCASGEYEWFHVQDTQAPESCARE